MPEEKQYFYIIPAELLEKGDITKALLYGIIYSFSKSKGYCWPSNKCLATKLHRKSTKRISNYLTELKNEKWINVRYKNRIYRKIYPLINLSSSAPQSNSSAPQSKPIALKSTKECLKKQDQCPEKQHSSINSSIKSSINKETINILKLWNKQEIMNCVAMTEKLSKLITVKIKDYSLELIKDAIENYSEIYHSKFYFNHPWSLLTFLKQGNALPSFFTEGGEKWKSYTNWYNSPEQVKERGEG